MLFSIILPVSAAALAHGSIMRRQSAGCQTIPSTAPPDGSFNNGAPQLAAMPPEPEGDPPGCYGPRDVDLPFGRLFHGNAKYFSAGQLNTPDGVSDKWYPDGKDSASQSACGIPDNAYSITKVAIHPYFLKYADLSRFCEQDVCISFWNEDGSSDMMLKVTDICSTDPSDPTHCESPVDIKLDRTKMKIMQHLTDQPGDLPGDQYPDKVWWFFMKCWGDGLPQPAYQGNNWFTTPKLPNNLKWAQSSQEQQWKNNQAAYPAKGWQLHPNGAYNPKRDAETSPAIDDWKPGDPTPAWQPIAGGKGFGMPGGGGGGGAAPAGAAGAASPPSSPEAPPSSASNSTGGSPPPSPEQAGNIAVNAPAPAPAPASPPPGGEGGEEEECEDEPAPAPAPEEEECEEEG